MIELHFIITLICPDGLCSTQSGIWTTAQERTRAEVYDQIHEWACEQISRTRVNVIYFSLEPNDLPVGRSEMTFS